MFCSHKPRLDQLIWPRYTKIWSRSMKIYALSTLEVGLVYWLKVMLSKFFNENHTSYVDGPEWKRSRSRTGERLSWSLLVTLLDLQIRVKERKRKISRRKSLVEIFCQGFSTVAFYLTGWALYQCVGLSPMQDQYASNNGQSHVFDRHWEVNSWWDLVYFSDQSWTSSYRFVLVENVGKCLAQWSLFEWRVLHLVVLLCGVIIKTQVVCSVRPESFTWYGLRTWLDWGK